ncbi:hypothetical protein EV356DRAFT_181975 [Viridothelium virens]|uniref:DUF974-domain-containing protein n=1 Tax=Viridothelium virens TaxID=1048519 RepID=A0A6A6H724_VIRVR|nr:hypothetical protein EV356DRAFT_181975 [Viridothelium virens]
MPHSRNASATEPVKGPHAVSLKVLRLSKPSLANQFPLPPISHDPNGKPPSSDSQPPHIAPSAAQAYPSAPPDPFAISPLLTLPPSFGLAYVGETFSCTLCANNEIDNAPSEPSSQHLSSSSSHGVTTTRSRSASASTVGSAGYVHGRRKIITGVQISAEMQTPSRPEGVPLELGAAPAYVRGSSRLSADEARAGDPRKNEGIELAPGASVQRIVGFELREEGNHVLAVTVTYVETVAPEDGGGGGASLVPGGGAAPSLPGQSRVRTFRKLYQFVAQQLLGVRTKAGALKRGWVLEAQLENLGDGAMSLETVDLNPKSPFRAQSLNWDSLPLDTQTHCPILKPHDVMQVMFKLEKEGNEEPEVGADGRPILGQLAIQWRSAMGDKGMLVTGSLSGKR